MGASLRRAFYLNTVNCQITWKSEIGNWRLETYLSILQFPTSNLQSPISHRRPRHGGPILRRLGKGAARDQIVEPGAQRAQFAQREEFAQ